MSGPNNKRASFVRYCCLQFASNALSIRNPTTTDYRIKRKELPRNAMTWPVFRSDKESSERPTLETFDKLDKHRYFVFILVYLLCGISAANKKLPTAGTVNSLQSYDLRDRNGYRKYLATLFDLPACPT